jgi:hypothetical protein
MVGTNEEIIALCAKVPEGGCIKLDTPTWIDTTNETPKERLQNRRRYRDLIRPRLALLWQNDRIPVRMHVFVDDSVNVMLCRHSDFKKMYPSRMHHEEKQ